ncbi:MAG: nucleotide-binding protein [Chloroflexi bacterium]|nr:nucleotide-binding protein [Chloroflexota bacterium]
MAKITILFVDNDVNFLSGRKERLVKNGYQVISASSPKKAWEILGQRKVDLVILDIRLNDDTDERDVSGLKLAKEIAALQLPIIVLTAYPVPEYIIEILRIVGDASSLKVDIVGKQEGYEAMSLAISRTTTIMNFKGRPQKRKSEAAKRDVFLVYGHDHLAKQEVMGFLARIGVHAIDISTRPSQGRTIIDQIKHYSPVDFAIVLLTSDDIVFSNGGTKSRRPRQNVVFELGLFIGMLGSDRVCTLRKGNTEILSDYHGVIYKVMDNYGAWKTELARELKAAGFDLDLKKILEA